MEHELNSLVDTLTEAPKAARPRIFARTEELEAQKADLEVDLAKLRITHGIRFTEAEVKAWLNQFCHGDPLDMAFRRKIIDVFINSVYLYDDRTIVFYNIQGGKQVSYIGLSEADIPDANPSEVSDLIASSPPNGHCTNTNCFKGGFAVKVRL
ncbi:MAG: hypothetical protein IJU28_07995 [Clostridia bacterium]|nr:hypothetical protein [Clostridia bacterium]